VVWVWQQGAGAGRKPKCGRQVGAGRQRTACRQAEPGAVNQAEVNQVVCSRQAGNLQAGEQNLSLKPVGGKVAENKPIHSRQARIYSSEKR